MKKLWKCIMTMSCVGTAYSLLTASAFAEDAAPSSMISEYLSLLQNHMKIKGLVPLYDRGVSYRVGDIWDPSMTRLLESSDRCFPKLAIRSASDSIPDLHYSKAATAGFMIGIRRLFDALASGDVSHTVTVTFQDVVEEVASEGDFRRF